MNINNILKTLTRVKLNDNSSKFNIPNNKLQIYQKFKENGFVIVRNFLDKKKIDDLKVFYKKEIINNPEKILFRQTTGLVEKNHLNHKGYLTNPIQNVHDLDGYHFKNYLNQVQEIVMSDKLYNLLFFFLKSNPVLIQTMQFELDVQTPPHHDAYYMNSKQKNGMVGVWFALENIKKESGRFYLLKKSHKKSKPNQKLYPILQEHKNYLNKIQSAVLHNNKDIIAPYLKKGDILIWDSSTIHGSAGVTNSNLSRFSMTAHYVKFNNSYYKGTQDIIIKPKRYRKFYFINSKDNNKIVVKIIMLISFYFPEFYKKIFKLYKKVKFSY